tara:strand:- start:67 stop:582 length:516 start_codon:yes stop_codon:yes gene_type:complete
MKYLLALLCSCLIAEAQSFKVYELLIPKEKIGSFSTPQEMIAAASSGGATIVAYADLPVGKNGVWSLDQTHLVQYAEEIDTKGQVTKNAERKVGIEVHIELQSDGRFDVTYCHTRLPTWIPRNGHPGAFLPMFTTTSVTPGAIHLDNYLIMGGLTNQDGVLNIIIQRIESK